MEKDDGRFNKTATTTIATAEAAEKIGQVITMETYSDCMENPKTCVFIGFGNERTNKRPNNLDAAAVSRTFEQYKGQGREGRYIEMEILWPYKTFKYVTFNAQSKY